MPDKIIFHFFNIMKLVLDDLIGKFINDLDTNNLPREIDIVLEGGGLNGSYELGIMMYIKKLEKLNKIKVNRISATSVGTLIGMAYILDELDKFKDMSNELINFFKMNGNFLIFKEMIYDFCKNHMDKNDYKLFENKFYLTYFNLKKKKQIIKSKYKSNKDLINQIIKSTYLPFLMDRNVHYKWNVDGCYPHIFLKRENTKILYISITSFKYIKGLLSIKNEINGNNRLFEGILDVNRFFNTNKPSDLCSYIDDWGIKDFIIVRIKELILVLVVIIFDITIKIVEFIPDNLKTNNYTIYIKQVIYKLINDIFYRIIN